MSKFNAEEAIRLLRLSKNHLLELEYYEEAVSDEILIEEITAFLENNKLLVNENS